MLLNGSRNAMKQVIRGHPELKYFVGMDVDSVAHDIAKPRLDAVLSGDGINAFTILRNFRDIKYVLSETGEQDLVGVDGILMDLGMSSMQVHSTTLYIYNFSFTCVLVLILVTISSYIISLLSIVTYKAL